MEDKKTANGFSIVADPREELDAELADLPRSEIPVGDDDLKALWPEPPKDRKMSAEDTKKFMRVGLRAHIVLRNLCREHYGEHFKDWPEDAKDVLNTLAIWGCHE